MTREESVGLLLIGVLDSQRGKQIGQTLAATLNRYFEERGPEERLLRPGQRGQPRVAEAGRVVRRPRRNLYVDEKRLG